VSWLSSATSRRAPGARLLKRVCRVFRTLSTKSARCASGTRSASPSSWYTFAARWARETQSRRDTGSCMWCQLPTKCLNSHSKVTRSSIFCCSLASWTSRMALATVPLGSTSACTRSARKGSLRPCNGSRGTTCRRTCCQAEAPTVRAQRWHAVKSSSAGRPWQPSERSRQASAAGERLAKAGSSKVSRMPVGLKALQRPHAESSSSSQVPAASSRRTRRP